MSSLWVLVPFIRVGMFTRLVMTLPTIKAGRSCGVALMAACCQCLEGSLLWGGNVLASTLLVSNET